jgi:trigger factor
VKVSAEKAEHSQVTMVVEMDAPEVEESVQAAYRHLVLKANVPGFRKGKAPRDVMERYFGKGYLLEHALEHLIPDACHKAISEQKIEAVAEPQIEITSVDPVVFKAVVPVRPTVKLCDYAAIRVEAKPATVTAENVDAAIEQLRQHQSIWTPVDRPVQYNDAISMKVTSCIGERQLLNEKAAPYRVTKGASYPLPGFPEELAGSVKGEQRDFNLVFPEDHPAAELRGQECKFQVTVNEIKEQTLPALDEAFAKSLGIDVETVEALREKVNADLMARAVSAERGRFEESALEGLVGCAQIEYQIGRAHV